MPKTTAELVLAELVLAELVMADWAWRARLYSSEPLFGFFPLIIQLAISAHIALAARGGRWRHCVEACNGRTLLVFQIGHFKTPYTTQLQNILHSADAKRYAALKSILNYG